MKSFGQIAFEAAMYFAEGNNKWEDLPDAGKQQWEFIAKHSIKAYLKCCDQVTDAESA